MDWKFDNSRPIFLQIIEKVQNDIVAGIYQPGERLPSVRDLASEIAVNPNTIQKAFTELEKIGLVFSQRTSGKFITTDQNLIDNIKNELAQEKALKFIKEMEHIGYKFEEVNTLLVKLKEEMNYD